MKSSHTRSRALRPFALAATMLALALPLTSHAQGNSGNNGNGNGNNGNGNGNNGVAPVPEPATWAAMISLAALGAVFAHRHYKKSGNSIA